jgi:hypothetical protein
MPDGNEAAKELSAASALGFKGADPTNVTRSPTRPSRRSEEAEDLAPLSSFIPTASRMPSACRASTSTM